MNRLKFKAFLWAVLMLAAFVNNVEPVSIAKSRKTTKSPSKTTATTTTNTTATSPRSSTSKPKSRPKNTKRTTTSPSTTSTVSPKSTIEDIIKIEPSSSFGSKKKQPTSSTTTLSPIEIMNKLYQMHGMSSHSSENNPSYHSHSHSSTSKKKPQKESSSMDEIYRLHALAMAQSSHSNKKHGSDSHSSSPNSNKQSYSSNSNSMENIYQQHSSMPSSMHHIMSQHSSSSSRPEKTKAPPKEGSSTSLTTFMQPLFLKQLTPVGAGIGVVLAPLLLFNGFLTFFSNMSRFLNNFAQTILPVRRPIGQTAQNQNYYQNIGPTHLKRQPRDWLQELQSMKEVHELTEFVLEAIKESNRKQQIA